MAQDLDKLVRVFIKIRDQKRELSAEFKEKESELNEKLDLIKAELLQHLKDNDLESGRSAHGTFYRSTKTKYWTSDWESMYKFIVENNTPELLARSIQQTNMREFLAEHPDLIPPGLNTDSEYTINVRKARVDTTDD